MLLTTKKRGRSPRDAARRISLAVLACALWAGLAGAGSAQEQVRFEAQQREGFGRLILTFPERMSLPEHRVTSDNGVLVITVEDTTMTGALPDVGTVLADYLAVARFDPDMTGIRMGMRGQLRINTIEAGEQLYIDLLPENWVGLPPGLPEDVIEKLSVRAEEAARLAEERRRAELAEEYDPVADIHVGRHPTFSRMVFDWNVGTKAQFSRDGDSATITFDWPVPVDLYPIQSAMPAEISAVANRVGPGSTDVRFTVPEDIELRFYEESSSQFILDIDIPGAEDVKFDVGAIAAELGVAVDAHGAAHETGEIATEESVEPVSEITPFVTAVGPTVRMVFPFADDTPAAVFTRGDAVWMVFDTDVTITPPDQTSADILDGLTDDLVVESAGSTHVVRMKLSENRMATLGSEGRAWVLSLGETILNATQPVGLERRQGETGHFEVTADLGDPFMVHQIRDPEVGDILEVVTVYPPARGIIRDLSFVDFQAPRSVHGLVVKPLHDGVSVRVEDTLAVIAAEAGLTLSPDQDIRFRMPEHSQASALDLAALYTPNPLQFERRRDELVAQAARAEGPQLDRARLDLAQFYLGNDLAYEALGVLSIMKQQLRQQGLTTAMNATAAAANALAGRAEEAMAILDVEPIRNEADAMIWRTIVRAETGDYSAARLDALGGRMAIEDYPRWVQSRFAMAAIRAAVMEDDADLAAELIQEVELTTLSRDQIAQYELLSGMLDHLNGNDAQALESFGRVLAADRRPTNAEAVLRTIELLDEMGRLEIDKGVGALEVQSTIWRGGPLELELVAKLTDLYYRQDNYRAAFVQTRELAGNHGSDPILDTMLNRARTEFAELYMDGRADALDPVEALSLYYDYRQLTPPGVDGDQMIRNLAQRLIKVDLLAQAAELLQYQVDSRLDGAARAQVAADLAVVYVANRNPDAALRVLNETRLAGLPPGLERQRRVLEASALIHANRQDLALDLLSGLTGRDTELLRIEALWSGGRHREASELIEALYVGDADADSLSPMGRSNLVKAAVGYVLDNDQIGLARLRARFSGAMSTTPEWPVFAFVTEDVDANGSGFRTLARQIADTDGINAFLNAYREIYANQNAVTPLRASEGTEAVASL